MRFKLQSILSLSFLLILLIENGQTETEKKRQGLRSRRKRIPRFHTSPIRPFPINFKAEDYEYLVKPLPDEKDQCPAQKRISKDYSSFVKVEDPNGIELNQYDLMRCEITGPEIKEEPKPRLIIHTEGARTDPGNPSIFANYNKEDCFSFRVLSTGLAIVYLYPELDRRDPQYVIITLGTKNNTQSDITDNHRTCRSCRAHETYEILNREDYSGFWIEWEDGTVRLGKEGEEDYLFSGDFGSSMSEIRFIGLASPSSSSHGIWKLEDPFCPKILKKLKEEKPKYKTAHATCHKIYEHKHVITLPVPDENKLAIKTSALIAEYDIERDTTIMTVKRIEDYFYPNLENLYFDEYIKLFKKCDGNGCDSDLLEVIEKNLTEFRNKLHENVKELPLRMNCSPNGNYVESEGKCICIFGYAGNGEFCERDSDYDGFPDDPIPDCAEDVHCRKDNCPKIPNPSQSDYNQNGIGDECEHLHRSNNNFIVGSDVGSVALDSVEETTTAKSSSSWGWSWNQRDESERPRPLPRRSKCAKIAPPNRGEKCTLSTDFRILEDYEKDKIEITFSQKNSTNKYTIGWDNDVVDSFTLTEKTDYFETRNLNKDNWKSFKKSLTYRLHIMYENYYVKIIVENSFDKQSTRMIWNTGFSSSPIEKLCFEDDNLEWVETSGEPVLEHYCD